jgi:hypothetical protein
MSARHVASPRRRHHSLVLSLALILSLLAAAPALAQQEPGHESHWGVAFSTTPSWTIHDNFKKQLFEGEGTIEGSELTIGLARGSNLGGDIGISFVRKPWKDGSGTTEVEQRCYGPGPNLPPCATETTRTVTEGVYMQGVEFSWFWAAATIKKRVQFGMKIAGGVASVNGNVVETRDGFDPTFSQSGTTLTPVHEVETFSAKDELIPIFPLLKLQAEGAVILAPGLKLKVAGGLNFPAVSFTVGLVYLFGAK